mgnify:CR=1 FL=1
MEIWALIIAKGISAIMSWIDAANLRNRVYTLTEQREILLTALDDVARVDADQLGGKIAKRTLDLMEKEHGVVLGKLDK